MGDKIAVVAGATRGRAGGLPARLVKETRWCTAPDAVFAEIHRPIADPKQLKKPQR